MINGETVEDNIPEDQSIAIVTKKGLVLVSGCGHAGIVNTLDHVSSIHGKNSKIVAALGGFHLFNKTNKDISWTTKHMRKHGVKYFLGAHCTGIDAVYQIRKHEKERILSAVGSYYDLNEGMYSGLISK